MKKLLLAAVCAMLTLSASAQRASSTSSSFFSTAKADEGVTFGVRVGLNFANVSVSGDDAVDDKYIDTRTAFNVGVITDIPLMQSLYVQTGLYFQSKGAKIDEDGYKRKFNPMYLQIPILASYRYNFSNAVQLQVNFGPYFACGVGGKAKIDDYGDEEEYDMFGDNGAYNRFDCGLQVGAGFTFAKHYNITFTYEFGLTNAAKNDVGDDISVKNRNCMLNIGYNF